MAFEIRYATADELPQVNELRAQVMLPPVQTHTLLPYYQEKTSENLRDFIATAGLDAQTTAAFREWLREASASGDKIILLVDHTLEAELPINTCLRFVNGEATQSAL